MTDRLDRRIGRFLEAGPDAGTRAGLASALARARTVDQRRGLPIPDLRRLPLASPVRLGLAAAAFLLLALTVGFAAARLTHRLPGNGPILTSVNGALTRLDTDRMTSVVIGDPAEHVEFPVASPDGTKVAFWTTTSFVRPWDLVVADLDMTDRHSVIPGMKVFADPTPIAWSPDGTRVAFQSVAPTGASQVHVVAIDGTGLQAILPTLSASKPKWSSDGKWIAVGVCDEAWAPTVIGIVIVRPDGTGVREVIRSWDDYARRSLSEVTWSPKGHELAFTWVGDATFTDDVPWSSSSTLIGVIDVESGRRRALTEGATDIAPSWSPDGDWIAFARHGTGVMLIRPDGTDLRSVVGEERSGPLTWAPDGSRFTVVVGDTDALVTVEVDGSAATETGLTGVITTPTWATRP